jgi:hypothetical protein
MDETIKTTVTMSKSLWKELRKRCIDLDIDTADGLNAAISAWIEKTAIQEKTTARRVQAFNPASTNRR